jgi:hypothetical protein
MEQQMITRRKAFAAAGVAAGALGATAALTGVRSVQATSGAVGDAVRRYLGCHGHVCCERSAALHVARGVAPTYDEADAGSGL